MSIPVDQVPLGTPIRWTCSCGKDLKPCFLSAADKFVGTRSGSICEVEVITEEEALAGGAEKPSH